EKGAPAQSIYMDSDGNVGIGTSSPAFAFDARITADKSIGQFTQEGAYDGTVYLQARGANSKKSLWYSLTKESNGNNSSVAFGAFEDNAIIEVEGSEKVRIDNVGNVGIGTASPNQQVTIEGTMDLKEQSAAGVDTAAYGQIWVKDSTPNELYFTDDAGTDTQISSHPLDAPTELYVNGPGLDWIGKRVQNYAGEIYWQTTDGTITIETFAEYNSRRQDIEGHVDLVAKDWDKVHRNQAVTKYMAEEIEVSKAEALEEKEKKEEVKTIRRKIEYKLNEETGEIEPVEKEESTTTLKGTGEYHKALKEGVRLDTETGKLYRKRTETEVEAMIQPEDIPSMPQWIKNRMK
ncbi:MAG: hypothetical protein KGY70_19670, partial [Bacteroidales bacterium]|nr:hypothetical protein [Bacteroidales bacterium]